MNAIESAQVLALMATVWPHTKIDGDTPEAWSVILMPLHFEDAKEAVQELARETQFIHVSDVVKRANVIRKRLLGEAKLELMEAVPPSSVDPDDSQAYIAWLRGAQQAAIDSVRERRRSRLALASA